MANEYAVPIYVLLGGAVCVAIGFTFQPLTEDSVTTAGSAKHLAQMQTERSFCRSHLKGVNCACFVQKSMYISSFNAPKIPGARYADRHALARQQAAKSC